MRALIFTLALVACAPTAHGVNNGSSGAVDPRLGRNHYSPEVVNDPYVRDKHRAVADALRRSCEQTGEHCDLADGARRFLDEQDGRR